MKNLNFNDFKKMGIELIINEQSYYVKFIPYPIEKEIYKRMPEYNNMFQDMFKMTDEQIERIREWIWGILSHEKNGNANITEKIFDEIGLTEMITIFISLVNFISERMGNMQKFLGNETPQKKTTEIQETKSLT